MSQEWMLDLLTDLRAAAEKGAMFDLAEHLDDAIVIAARELRASASAAGGLVRHDELGHGLPGSYRDV